MAITFPNSARFTYGATPISLSLGGSVAVGDLIFGGLFADDPAITPTVTDNLSTPTSYTIHVLPTDTGGNKTWLFWGIAQASGTPTLTCDTGNGTGLQGPFFSATGFSGTPSIDVSNYTASGNSNTVAAAVTTTIATTAICVVMHNTENYFKNAGSGWTIPQNSGGGYVDVAYQTQTSTGTYGSSIATMGAAGNWVAATIAFGVSGGGGGRTLFYRPGLDGLSIAGPKQFNPTL